METYKFKCTTKSSDNVLWGVWTIVTVFFMFTIVQMLYTHPELVHLIESHEIATGLAALLLYFVWRLGEKKLLRIAVKEFTVQLDNLTITVWENGKEAVHGKVSACKIKTKPGRYTMVDITVGAENLSFRGRPTYYKVPLTGGFLKNAFGDSSKEDLEQLLALGKALRQNLGLDAGARRRPWEAATAEAELEKKWNRDIPEMDDLFPEENRIILRQAKIQIIVICAILLIIELFLLRWLVSESPMIQYFFDLQADVMNKDLALALTREQRIGIYFGGAVFMLPAVLLVLLPQIIIIFGFRKKFIKRAAGKYLRHWRLTRGQKTTARFTFRDVEAGMDALQYNVIQYLMLAPPAGIMRSSFMQTYHQKGNLFVLEVKTEGKEGPALCRKSSLTKEQVLSAMDDYMNKRRIPDTSGWEKINPSPGQAESLE